MSSFQFSWIIQMTFLLLQGKNMFNDFKPEIKEKIQDWEFGCCKKCKLRTLQDTTKKDLCSKYNMLITHLSFVCKSFTPIKQEELKSLCQK